MSTEIIRVPDIGSSDPVDVIELLVKVGDSLAQDDSMLVLESAKASVEVPSPSAGKVVKLLVQVGARVNTGDALLEMEVAAGAAATPVGASRAGEQVSLAGQAPAESLQGATGLVGASHAGEQVTLAGQAPAESLQGATGLVGASHAGEQASLAGQAPAESLQGATDLVGASHAGEQVALAEQPPTADLTAIHAGPAVRKLARQLGVDLAQLTQASGAHQRIVKEDLYEHVAKRLQQPVSVSLASLPEIDFAQFGAVERVATSNLKRTAAARLQQNWQAIPQVTQHELADITELETFRQAENKRNPQTKLSLLAFVARALVASLHEFPQFNASLSANGEQLILKKYLHLGVAVDSERGLLVPVLKNADRLGARDIAAAVAELAVKARSRKLLPADMQGASFTISSLGGIGGTAFTPLVNHPEVAILGLSRADWQPVWQADKGEFAPRLLLPLSLSYDHRVIDGADAARFVVHLREQLTDIRRLLL